MPSNTIERVPDNTAEHLNEAILARTARSVLHHARHRDRIDRRLRELDREWDIERLLEANAGLFGFLGVALGTGVDRRWLGLSALVGAFLFQHAVQGWCPPVPLFRRWGVRTAREIELERIALKALRGDFDDAGEDPSRALAAAAL
ncbi:MAG: DUF2892 domain-containing protein [Enhydrobacter sp.]|nr:MAG: DUF2892 domain-containing protein [Enhydrobacter sp.]